MAVGVVGRLWSGERERERAVVVVVVGLKCAREEAVFGVEFFQNSIKKEKKKGSLGLPLFSHRGGGFLEGRTDGEGWEGRSRG